MSTTEQYPDFTGLTFEKVWAALMENREQQKETDRQMKETDRQMKENEAKFQKHMQESWDRIAKSEARLHREIGFIGNRMGSYIEHLVAAGAKKRFNDLGFHFDEIDLRKEIVDRDTGRTLTELDIVLENGESVIVVEIKMKPSAADVKKHIQRLQIYREYRNRLHPGETKKIYGAAASPVFPKENLELAIQAGFYTITQSGKSIVVNVPEGFQPRAF